MWMGTESHKNMKHENFGPHIKDWSLCCPTEEFEEKCESTGEAGVSGVCVMSGGQPVPWE